MSRKCEDLMGRKFGHWTVIERSEDYVVPSNGQHRPRWVCKCDCENQTIQNVLETSLLNGISYQCKFCRDKIIGIKNTKHGDSYNRLYKIWVDMKKRCYNHNNKEYDNYGGRGILVCNAWIEYYTSFKNWAYKNGYQDNLTIERIDVNKNYCPENCKWTNQKEQQNNKRNNRLLTYNNETHNISEWSEITDISFYAICTRIDKLGWSIEKALTTPVRNKEAM